MTAGTRLVCALSRLTRGPALGALAAAAALMCAHHGAEAAAMLFKPARNTIVQLTFLAELRLPVGRVGTSGAPALPAVTTIHAAVAAAVAAVGAVHAVCAAGVWVQNRCIAQLQALEVAADGQCLETKEVFAGQCHTGSE